MTYKEEFDKKKEEMSMALKNAGYHVEGSDKGGILFTLTPHNGLDGVYAEITSEEIRWHVENDQQ